MAVAIEEEMEEAKVSEGEGDKILDNEKEEEVALMTSERVSFIMGNELLPPANNSSQRSTSPGGRKGKQLTLNTGKR